MYIYFRSVESWKNHFSQDFIFVEQIFIQLASVVLNRKIKIYSVIDKESRDRTIDPHENCSCGLEAPAEPLYFLYFEDAHFISPHYQSIRPKCAPIVPDIPQSQPEQVI